MIRIYPIKFRYLDGDNKFSKYQWIKAEIRKSKKDPRPESFNINDESIVLGSKIDTIKDGWVERERWVLNEKNVYKSVEDLQAARESDNISLGIVKPKSIIGFKIVRKGKIEIKQAESRKKTEMAQLNMLGEKQDLELLPFRFVLQFSCDHTLCKGHEYSILDWEIAELYRKIKDEKNWEESINDKIMNTIFGEDREVFLILGNMVQHQHVFCVLGFFWPPKQRQQKLFFDQ